MPKLLLQTTANRQTIVACCDLAATHGIKPGMTLAQARALCAKLDAVAWRPDLDEKSLEALARYLTRFTPVVALATRDVVETDATLPPHVFLDLTGCEHLFGGLRPMCEQIATTLQRLRIPAGMAVAPTPAAAYALTYTPLADRPTQVAGPAYNRTAIVALRLPDDVRQSLHHLGIETIGQLQKLPREQLPSRFGRLILQRLDQLTGKIPEPLIALPFITPVLESLDFDGLVSDPLSLETIFQSLLTKVLLTLERRGLGIGQLVVTLKRSDAPAAEFALNCSRPSRDARALMILYRCAFDKLAMPKSPHRHDPYARNAGDGFLSITLDVQQARPLQYQQVELAHAAHAGQEHAWQGTVDLIRTRLGDESIEQVELQESYLPEHAYKRTLEVPAPSAAQMIPADRPLQMLAPPAELRVMVSPSHDADGSPLSFNLQGSVHKVIQSVGPERIAGQWWEGHNKTRDYFDVADDSGSHYWIFRVQETGKWYLHGLFT